ncbi:MAG: protease inhibitor I42 family protein [Actinomycetota bacterium]|nr:protease inhibitor I42 family protein [Actinomycetota bacterium]
MSGIKKIKITVIVFLSAVMLLFCLNGCASGKTLTEKNNGDSINMKVNDTVEIKLVSNPATGYGWVLDESVDSSIVSIGGPEFIESEKEDNMVGAGGHEVFVIKVVSKGKASIILNYERPWEEEEPVDTFEVNVTVE